MRSPRLQIKDVPCAQAQSFRNEKVKLLLSNSKEVLCIIITTTDNNDNNDNDDDDNFIIIIIVWSRKFIHLLDTLSRKETFYIFIMIINYLISCICI